MKNITVTVSDELYRHARMWAARENTTVTSLVRRFLESPREETPHEPSLSYSVLLGYELETDEDPPTPLPISSETVRL
jgi:hypothetical protein